MSNVVFRGLRLLALAAVASGALLTFAPTAQAQSFDFQTPGADKTLRASLKAASLVLGAEQDGITNPQDLLAAARADYGRLLAALYADARYAGVISITIDGREAASIDLLENLPSIRSINVVVQPGPAFQFSAARMRPYAPGTAIPPAYGDQKPARSTAIVDAAAAGVEGWRNVGHAKARVVGQDIVADHPSRTVSSLVLLDAGPKVTFGSLTLEGYARLRPKRLAEIAGFPTGKTFSPKEIRIVEDRLRRSGIFRSISLVEGERVNPDGTLPFTLVVEEEAPRRLGFGAEVSSFDGISVSGYWLHRNLLGGGERFRIDGAISGIAAQTGGADYSLSARIDRPATFSPNNTAFATALIERVDEADYTADNLSVSFGLKRTFREIIEGEAALAFVSSDVTDAFGTSHYRQIAFPLSAAWDKRNVPLDATRGFYAKAEVKPFLGFGTAANGLRLYADARYYRGFGADDRVVFATRLQGGTVTGPNLLQTPREDLFYSGGGSSVRGQPYQSLGVNVLRSGALATGGQSFVAASGEVRLRLNKRVGVVGFVDVGGVSPFDFFSGGIEWHSGAGVGLRYDTPIGPIRFDVAAPVSGTTGDGMQIYVGIGQAF